MNPADMNSSKRSPVFDVMRGLTIAMMILVNTPGSWDHRYAALSHADWNGCTPTDLVLPFFLFVVGAAMYFAFRPYHFSWSLPLAEKIGRRSMIIFLLGLVFNAVLDHQTFTNLRIMGVLQRIALAYVIAAIIVLSVRRIYIYLISIVLLLGYWGLLYAAGGSDPFGLSSNVVVRSDIFLLGPVHLWQGKGVPFDPEGILSSLPSVVNVLIGFELARYTSAENQRWRAVGLLTVAGLNLVILGLLWSLWLPINKSLWTSSYVIYSAGYFSLVLAVAIWVVDIKRWDAIAKPLLVLGSNSLFIYFVAAFWVHSYNYIPVRGVGDFYQASFLWLAKFMQPLNASLAFALAHVGLFWCLSYFLFRRRIFIKV